MLLPIVLLTLCAASQASPVYSEPVYYRPSQGWYSRSPVVRAAPAFHGPAFAPVRKEQPSAEKKNDETDGSYSFEYAVQAEDGGHSRQETRDPDGTVRGRYTIALADGRLRTVDYIADKDGFKAKVDTNEPGTESRAPASVQWSSTAVRSPTPQVVRSTKVPQIVSTTPEEPRSPHHPAIGFVPPDPFSRIHLAPPKPIELTWQATPVYYDPALSSAWPTSQAPFIISSYPLKNKR